MGDRRTRLLKFQISGENAIHGVNYLIEIFFHSRIFNSELDEYTILILDESHRSFSCCERV